MSRGSFRDLTICGLDVKDDYELAAAVGHMLEVRVWTVVGPLSHFILVASKSEVCNVCPASRFWVV